MKARAGQLALVLATSLCTNSVFSATQIRLDKPINLSASTGAPAAENAASKGKIIRLTDGTLVSVYADAVDSAYKSWNYAGDIFSARDVFVNWSKDNGVTWTTPLNVSNTAAQTDAGKFYDPDGNGADNTGGTAPMNFYGDSEKPNIFAAGNGNNIMVSWPDNYCPSGVQGVVEYTAPYLSLDSGVIQVPFSCIYIARMVNTADTINLIAVDRLSDASRDAKGDVARGGSGGGNAIVWQEVPEGMQPGDPSTNDNVGVFTGEDYGWYFTEKFNLLVERASISELEAFYVGAFIEELDMLDINQCPKVIVETDNGIDDENACGKIYTDNADVANLYESLQAGSDNHLAAYVKNIERVIGEGNYQAQVLTQDQVDVILDR